MLVLRTRGAAESEADSVDHVRPQQQHQDNVKPGAGRPSINPMIPPYPRGRKHQTQRKLEGVPGAAPASS